MRTVVFDVGDMGVRYLVETVAEAVGVTLPPEELDRAVGDLSNVNISGDVTISGDWVVVASVDADGRRAEWSVPRERVRFIVGPEGGSDE